MDSIFRKLLYTSVGFISLSADKLIRLIDDLVYEQKISSEEGKRIVEDFSKNSQSKKEEFDGQVTDWVQDFMSKWVSKWLNPCKIFTFVNFIQWCRLRQKTKRRKSSCTIGFSIFISKANHVLLTICLHIIWIVYHYVSNGFLVS